MRQKILPRDAESRRKKAGKGVSRRRDYEMFHMEHFPTKTENPLGRRRKSRREGHNYISRETLRGDPPGCSPVPALRDISTQDRNSAKDILRRFV